MKKCLLYYLILLCITAYSYGFWNRGELRDEIRRQINDVTSDTALQRWSDTVLNSRISAAQEDIVMRTRFLVEQTTIAVNNTTTRYALPTNCLMPIRICYDNDGSSTSVKYDDLEYWTLEGLDNKYQYWDLESSGTPKRYCYIEDDIMIHPPADETHSGAYGNLRIDYILRPSSFTSDSGIPFSDSEGNANTYLFPFHGIIISYVCALCATDEGDAETRNFYWTKYLADIDVAIKYLQSRPDKIRGDGVNR